MIEDEIELGMAAGSSHAVAATALMRILYDDDDSELSVGVLRVLRPMLTGALAEDVDAQLAKPKEEEAA